MQAFQPDQREGLFLVYFLPGKAMFQPRSAESSGDQPAPVGKKGLTAYRPFDVSLVNLNFKIQPDKIACSK